MQYGLDWKSKQNCDTSEPYRTETDNGTETDNRTKTDNENETDNRIETDNGNESDNGNEHRAAITQLQEPYLNAYRYNYMCLNVNIWIVGH